ncbi:MAG: malto-oligosyltrehalose trehalohydrolase [Actinobacteria bacterium]|nr:malto-oligosyltrehalose trehalohydrolase [Actinomycetota bacterium]
MWAPRADSVEVHLLARESGQQDLYLPMRKGARGYFFLQVPGTEVGARYYFRLEGNKEFPDPASRYQPEGAAGPSQVWSRVKSHAPPPPGSRWAAPPPEELIIYELHVGAFTPEGTFAGVRRLLSDLGSLGINAVELMPVSQFPGKRSWGYDGVLPFAAQNTYGGPAELAALVEACHEQGMAVILDVVYNHLGPEGNSLPSYGPYLREECGTPWGASVNFDGPGSDEVRRYYVENALYWLAVCGIDGLRLDAVHSILDRSAVPFLQQLAAEVAAFAEQNERRVYLFLENENNDARCLLPSAEGGFGLTAQWNDDFHHALHTLVTGEAHGYYADFGRLRDLALAIEDGFVYGDRYSEFRSRHHGSRPRGLTPKSFIIFAQNHDQVGNRPLGERLSALVGWESLKLAAGAVLLAPAVPMLFMGEEWGEQRPFLFFCDYEDPQLIEAVREGRRREFAAVAALTGGSAGDRDHLPDPQAEETFLRSRVEPSYRDEGEGRVLVDYYRSLIRLRKTRIPSSLLRGKHHEVQAMPSQGLLVLRRQTSREQLNCLLHFGTDPTQVKLDLRQGSWERLLDSAEERWLGPGSLVPREIQVGRRKVALVDVQPHSVLVFSRPVEGSY